MATCSVASSGPGPSTRSAADQAEAASISAASTAGETATVRRIVARLERMPPEQARLVASAAYTLARAAHADLDISDEETAAMERELQAHGWLDEPTAVLVTEMAKLQAKTVGGTEDYVVTREFAALATGVAADRRPAGVLRGRCRQRLDLGRGVGAVNQIAKRAGARCRWSSARSAAEFHDRLSSVQEVRRRRRAGLTGRCRWALDGSGSPRSCRRRHGGRGRAGSTAERGRADASRRTRRSSSPSSSTRAIDSGCC